VYKSQGIVSEVVPADRLDDRSQQIAERLAAQDPDAVRRTRAALWAALERP